MSELGDTNNDGVTNKLGELDKADEGDAGKASEGLGEINDKGTGKDEFSEALNAEHKYYSENGDAGKADGTGTDEDNPDDSGTKDPKVQPNIEPNVEAGQIKDSETQPNSNVEGTQPNSNVEGNVEGTQPNSNFEGNVEGTQRDVETGQIGDGKSGLSEELNAEHSNYLNVEGTQPNSNIEGNVEGTQRDVETGQIGDGKSGFSEELNAEHSNYLDDLKNDDKSKASETGIKSENDEIKAGETGRSGEGLSGINKGDESGLSDELNTEYSNSLENNDKDNSDISNPGNKLNPDNEDGETGKDVDNADESDLKDSDVDNTDNSDINNPKIQPNAETKTGETGKGEIGETDEQLGESNDKGTGNNEFRDGLNAEYNNYSENGYTGKADEDRPDKLELNGLEQKSETKPEDNTDSSKSDIDDSKPIYENITVTNTPDELNINSPKKSEVSEESDAYYNEYPESSEQDSIEQQSQANRGKLELGNSDNKLSQENKTDEDNKDNSEPNSLEKESKNDADNSKLDHPEKENNRTTKLWRAVEQEELTDVAKYNDYNIDPKSTFKTFYLDESGVDSFIKANPDRVYTKTYIEIPTEELKKMDRHADTKGDYVGVDVYEHPELYDNFGEVNIVLDNLNLMHNGSRLGQVPVPQDAPTPQVLGQQIEDPIRQLVAQHYGFELSDKSPNATGPDIDVPADARTVTGFDIADVKPANVDGLRKFWKQLDNWRDNGWSGGPESLNGRAALFMYDKKGNVYLYGIYDM